MAEIQPVRPPAAPPRAVVAVPGSKSITNRALLLAALAEGEVTLTGALFSDDTSVMAESLSALGFSLQADPAARTIRVRGEGGRIPARSARLHVGNAGTAARFLTALLALAPEGDYEMDGVPQMRRRPMRGLLDALAGAGVRIESADGCLPLRFRGGPLRGGRLRLDASESSQMLSALLLVAPYAQGPLEIELTAGTVSTPFVALTLGLLRQFGQPVDPAEEELWRSGSPPRLIRGPWGQPHRAPGPDFAIEPDATAASYFLALPLAAGGEVTVAGIGESGLLQGDVGFARILREVGMEVEATAAGLRSRRGSGPLRGGDWDFGPISDTFLTLAALAPLLPAPVRLHGIGHTRRQETDRIAAMANELRRLGQNVQEEGEALRVSAAPLQPAVIETYHDHRVAMSFGILGAHDLHGNGSPWLSIRDPGCCAKTFPDFFQRLDATLGWAAS